MGSKHGAGKAMAALSLCMAMVLPAAPLLARQAPRRSNALPAYDLSKELKVRGTIGRISTRSSSADGLPGTHLLLHTDRGTLDAHLGWGFSVRAERMRLKAGQPVVLTGMMTRYNGRSVLVVRILTTSSHIYVLRNERGLPVRALTPSAPPAPAPPLEEGL
ncbi:MAG TPA: hypothetical protein VN661_01045 [Candidatus Acidoferrales bacterium]|nr:hypothetical protein [Candidatus Acidoferrales bacterium]